MARRAGVAATLAATTILALVLLAGCTGGQEGKAAEEQQPKKNPITGTQAADGKQPAAPQPAPPPDRTPELRALSSSIPIYQGARYREDLTRRDAVMIHNQYGPQADVITLATDDSYPQVYHYYITYLAQFRAYPTQPPYPAAQTWRSLEVPLNQAMQDPFIPGNALKPGSRQITLQIAETEAEPRTVIRYIMTSK
jgi:hypothetical protein